MPADVKTYEYWEGYFRKAVHHPYGKRPAAKPVREAYRMPASARPMAVAVVVIAVIVGWVEPKARPTVTGRAALRVPVGLAFGADLPDTRIVS